MKRSIEPFRTFLGSTSASPEHTALALEIAEATVRRLDEADWPLAPAAELDLQEVLETYRLMSGLPIAAARAVSRAELKVAPMKVFAIMEKFDPCDAKLLFGGVGAAIETKMGPEVDKRCDAALMQVIDPEGKGPPPQLMASMPIGLIDALISGICGSFLPVPAASTQDPTLFDAAVRCARLVQRCLVLGFEDASRETLLVMTA